MEFYGLNMFEPLYHMLDISGHLTDVEPFACGAAKTEAVLGPQGRRGLFGGQLSLAPCANPLRGIQAVPTAGLRD